MVDDNGGFGGRLRALRAAAGISQQELAERSGLSIRAIGNLERGRTRWPYRHSLKRIADSLGLAGAEREAFIAVDRRPAASDGKPGGDPSAV
jgi:transcriptional regulator with XRE-family HTH domain